jgi:sulfide:quinone oxidoreductase
MEFVHVPVVPGKLGNAEVEAFTAAMEDAPRPVVGFCKSGMRATSLWALSQAGRCDPDQVIAACAEAGYDLSPLRPRLG